MGAVSRLLRSWRYDAGGQAGVHFWCPGCGCAHKVITEGAGAWGFNGNVEAPTFTPSVLVRSGHFAEGHKGECWCTFEQRTGRTSHFKCFRCHSFVTDGRIQFLNDSTHALAGQTVPLPEWPAHSE